MSLPTWRGGYVWNPIQPTMRRHTPHALKAIEAKQLKMVIVLAALAFALEYSTYAATTLTGLVGMGTTSTGGWTGDARWNTQGGDSIVSCFVTSGSTFNDPFINGPSDAAAGISVPLAFGTHSFTIFAPGGIDNLFHGLNLFFNGVSTSPAISAFAPTRTSSLPPFPGFMANGALNSQSLAGQTVPAANSLSFNDGTSIVTLTDFFWAAPEVYNLDRAGFVPFGNAFVGPDGRPDRVAQFTLSVVPVPEPSTWTLIGMGILGILLRRRK